MVSKCRSSSPHCVRLEQFITYLIFALHFPYILQFLITYLIFDISGASNLDMLPIKERRGFDGTTLLLEDLKMKLLLSIITVTATILFSSAEGNDLLL